MLAHLKPFLGFLLLQEHGLQYIVHLGGGCVLAVPCPNRCHQDKLLYTLRQSRLY